MGTTASNQHLAGIDLSQTGSNLGSSEGGSHQPEEKELSAGDKAAQPELSGRDDPLLDELREQCYDHRAELNFLTGLSLPYGPYVQIWLGPSGTELAPLFPNAEVWPPDWLNSKNDHQEFTASSISLVTANYYAALTLYQDGTIEHCCLDQFYKQGSFELYYPSLPYLEAENGALKPHLLKQSGLFYQDLPCGPFKLFNENGVCVAMGCYELVEAAPDEPSKEVDPRQLRFFLKRQSQLDLVKSMIEPKEKIPPNQRWSKSLQPIKVCLNKIVVRYAALSRRLPHDQLQSFEIGPERPYILLQRHANETWLEACTRAHQKVLALVQKQVNELQQAQCAAAQLLVPALASNAEPNYELTTIQEQLAAPLHYDEVGTQVHQQCLQCLGKQQPTELVAGCVNGGYAQAMLDCLPRTADGHYLNGILVSSAAYFEEQCYLKHRILIERALNSSNQADPNTKILILAYRIHHQPGNDTSDIDLDTAKLSKREISWLKDECAPLLNGSDVEDTPCTLKRWGEVQPHDRAQAWYRTAGHSSSLSQEHLVNLSHLLYQQYFDGNVRSAQKVCDLHLGHYFCGRHSLSNTMGANKVVIPIWGAWDTALISIDEDIDVLQHYFNWRATGCSSVYDAEGTTLGQLEYDNYGLLGGKFELLHASNQVIEVGTCEQGQLLRTLSFTIYQDFRARFPSASFTVDLAQGAFIGPYQQVYSIAELFDAGYHAVMLVAYDEVETDDGDYRALKRLSHYRPGTYLQEEGTYLEDGTIQVTKQYELEPYQRPRYRRPWYYDEDDEDEDSLIDDVLI